MGIAVTVIFVTWSLLAYRADAEAIAATASDDKVMIDYEAGIWRFEPIGNHQRSALVFFPGALVDPRAYAPLARSVAEIGYSVILVELPYRGAFGGAESPELWQRTKTVLGSIPADHFVVVGGHSRGAVVASSLAARGGRLNGMAIIGSSHPRDVDLSNITIPVVKIVGTHDGLASPEEVKQNAHLMPAHTRWIWVEGGNHSQFGWYGFQPLDRFAEISATEQRNIMTSAVADLLRLVDNHRQQ